MSFRLVPKSVTLNDLEWRNATPENIILKLCTRDYVREISRHANFSFNQYSGASPQIGVIF